MASGDKNVFNINDMAQQREQDERARQAEIERNTSNAEVMIIEKYNKY